MPVEIFYSAEFRRDYKKLRPGLQTQLKTRGQLFQQDPFHPLLRTHKLSGKLQGFWSFSLDFHYRVIFKFMKSGEILLLRVGDHSIYRKS